jgi:hypothetical protein
MKALSIQDTGILALLAQLWDKSTPAENWVMMKELSSADARKIAYAILDQDLSSPEAKAFLQWAGK